ISEWQLAFAAMSGDELHLMWTLEPTELTRSLGFAHFRAGYRMILGQRLTLELTVANDSGNSGAADSNEMQQGGAPLVFEAAFHTYYAVGDARQVTVQGLGNTEYID